MVVCLVSEHSTSKEQEEKGRVDFSCLELHSTFNDNYIFHQIKRRLPYRRALQCSSSVGREILYPVEKLDNLISHIMSVKQGNLSIALQHGKQDFYIMPKRKNDE